MKNKRSHNKKRNVGIIFEQLTRHLSAAIINEDRTKALSVLSIIREHFRPGTELYKEFRLFNALIKTRVPRENLAIRIIEDARNASRKFDANLLRHEKSLLIKTINHGLNDSSFYSQRISEYRNYATIQTLLNDWRKDDNANLSRVVKYENEVINWLLSESLDKNEEKYSRDDINALTIKIMNEKFNKKYLQRLNKEQKEIVKQYIFTPQNSNSSVFIEECKKLREDTLKGLRNYSIICDNDVLNEKINGVVKKIENFDINEMNDDTVSRLLTISKLREELLENKCE